MDASLASNVGFSIPVFMSKGSVVLFICSTGRVLYSAGSGVKKVQMFCLR